jgi:hypothetical protein
MQQKLVARDALTCRACPRAAPVSQQDFHLRDASSGATLGGGYGVHARAHVHSHLEAPASTHRSLCTWHHRRQPAVRLPATMCTSRRVGCRGRTQLR